MNGEMVEGLLADQFPSSPDNGPGDLAIQETRRPVGLGSRPLDAQERLHQSRIVADGALPCQGKIVEGALGLGSVKGFPGNLDFAQEIVLHSGRGRWAWSILAGAGLRLQEGQQLPAQLLRLLQHGEVAAVLDQGQLGAGNQLGQARLLAGRGGVIRSSADHQGRRLNLSQAAGKVEAAVGADQCPAEVFGLS